MTRSEKTIAITTKLLEARRTLQRLYPRDYEQLIEPYKQAILGESASREEYLVIAMRLIEELLAIGQEGTATWVMAAVCDLIEPQRVTEGWPDFT